MQKRREWSTKTDTRHRWQMIKLCAKRGLGVQLLYQLVDPYFPARLYFPSDRVKSAFKKNPGAALGVATRILQNYRVVRTKLGSSLPRQPIEPDSECRQCGACCAQLMPLLLAEDISRWRSDPQTAWIAELWGTGHGGYWGDHQGLAQDPFTDRLPYCPFLMSYPENPHRTFCSIHATKPLNCRWFNVEDARKVTEAGQISCQATIKTLKLKDLPNTLEPFINPWRVTSVSESQTVLFELHHKLLSD